MTTTNQILQVLKLSSNATIPKRGSKLAAGFDLSSAQDSIIPARGKGLVKTDLSIAIPEGCYARVAPRSGLAYKNHIDTAAGVIDRDYRGNVGVILFNHSNEDFEVKKGDRVAQLILERISYANIEEVTELSETERGDNGFGSTGIDKGLDQNELLQPEKEKEKNKPDHDFQSKYNDLEVVFNAIDRLARYKIKFEWTIENLRRIVINGNEKEMHIIKFACYRYLQTNDPYGLKEWVNSIVRK